MLDERKVKLMTRLAMYEETQGKEDFQISGYYKQDYIGMHIISSVIWVTIGYAALTALIVLASFSALMSSWSNSMVLMLGLILVVGYLGLLIIYGIISGSIYGKKYRDARMRVRRYNHNLLRLLKWYDQKRRK